MRQPSRGEESAAPTRVSRVAGESNSQNKKAPDEKPGALLRIPEKPYFRSPASEASDSAGIVMWAG